MSDKPSTTNSASSKSHRDDQRYSFWDGIMNQFSDLSFSVVEIILKTVLSFAILIFTIIALSVSVFTQQVYFIPLSILLATTLSMIFIWKNTNRSLPDENLESLKAINKQLTKLKAENLELEKRLKNIEVVERFEERLARQQLDREDSVTEQILASKVPLTDQPDSEKTSSTAQSSQSVTPSSHS